MPILFYNLQTVVVAVVVVAGVVVVVAVVVFTCNLCVNPIESYYTYTKGYTQNENSICTMNEYVGNARLSAIVWVCAGKCSSSPIARYCVCWCVSQRRRVSIANIKRTTENKILKTSHIVAPVWPFGVCRRSKIIKAKKQTTLDNFFALSTHKHALLYVFTFFSFLFFCIPVTAQRIYGIAWVCKKK